MQHRRNRFSGIFTGHQHMNQLPGRYSHIVIAWMLVAQIQHLPWVAASTHSPLVQTASAPQSTRSASRMSIHRRRRLIQEHSLRFVAFTDRCRSFAAVPAHGSFSTALGSSAIIPSHHRCRLNLRRWTRSSRHHQTCTRRCCCSVAIPIAIIQIVPPHSAKGPSSHMHLRCR